MFIAVEYNELHCHGYQLMDRSGVFVCPACYKPLDSSNNMCCSLCGLRVHAIGCTLDFFNRNTDLCCASCAEEEAEGWQKRYYAPVWEGALF